MSLDDPRLFEYPVAYIIEVSWWTMTDRQGARLREYMKKGGFVIVDDFKAEGDFGSAGWAPFEANMQRVLPGAKFVEMKASHPIFHAFFELNSLEHFPQAYNAGPPSFLGLFEDNDPTKRLRDDRQLQHRHLAVLGVVRPGHPADRRHQRSLQARGELHHLRPDALTPGRPRRRSAVLQTPA